MKRLLVLSAGLLQLGIAGVILQSTRTLPDSERISSHFEKAGNVTNNAEKQIQLLRDEVTTLRSQELKQLAMKLSEQTRAISATLETAQIDFRTLESVARVFDEIARGVDQWAIILDAGKMKQLSDSLGVTADFLDKQVAGSALEAAKNLEPGMNNLALEAGKLSALLRITTPDLKATAEVYDALNTFDLGLEKMGMLLLPERLRTIRDGFDGMQNSLDATAGSAEKLGGYSYPFVKLNGFKPPEIEMRPFWNEGKEIAEGLRKASKGVNAATQELDGLNKSLPALTSTLTESRKILRRTRESLGLALKQQKELERLMQTVPKLSANLAEQLPATGRNFVTMLKETEKLRTVADGLRQARTQMDQAIRVLPGATDSLRKSSLVLNQTREKFNTVLARRTEYEAGLRSSTELAKTFTGMMPLFAEQLDLRLGQQDHTLGEMQKGLSEINSELPETRQQAIELTGIIRWMAFLVAGLMALHGVQTLLSLRTGKPLGTPLG